MTDTQVLTDSKSGLTYRFRPIQDDGSLNFFMFHGLTGNEDVMWIFARSLPQEWLMGCWITLPGARQRF